jgi:hypothetical protein
MEGFPSLAGHGVSAVARHPQGARSIDVGSAREGAHAAQVSLRGDAVTYPE